MDNSFHKWPQTCYFHLGFFSAPPDSTCNLSKACCLLPAACSRPFSLQRQPQDARLHRTWPQDLARWPVGKDPKQNLPAVGTG